MLLLNHKYSTSHSHHRPKSSCVTMDIAELAMMLESIDSAPPTEEEFQASAARISSYGWLPDDQKLQFYGLFKQCTIGDVNTKQPWAINMVAKAKWYIYVFDVPSSWGQIMSSSCSSCISYCMSAYMLWHLYVGITPLLVALCPCGDHITSCLYLTRHVVVLCCCVCCAVQGCLEDIRRVSTPKCHEGLHVPAEPVGGSRPHQKDQ